MRPVPPNAPPELLPLLQDFRSAILELQSPTKPVSLAAVLNAALPPADAWRGCAVFVSDKDCIAISTDVAGTYTWLRADGSAL